MATMERRCCNGCFLQRARTSSGHLVSVRLSRSAGHARGESLAIEADEVQAEHTAPGALLFLALASSQFLSSGSPGTRKLLARVKRPASPAARSLQPPRGNSAVFTPSRFQTPALHPALNLTPRCLTPANQPARIPRVGDLTDRRNHAALTRPTEGCRRRGQLATP